MAVVDTDLLRFAGVAETGRCVVAYPHVKQVVVPDSGARLIIGTDGLWDALSPQKVFSVSCKLAPAAAAQRLCNTAFGAHVCSVSFLPAGAIEHFLLHNR